ncbi:MAG: xanthine dehydrogenase family protein subunit M [Thermoplasmata archaeon]
MAGGEDSNRDGQCVWLRPSSLTEALSMLYERLEEKVMVVGGSTDILPQMKDGKRNAKVFVDLYALQDLKKIKEDENYISIGSMVTMSALTSNPLVQKFCPALSVAAHSVGSAQIRSRATIGGNICNASPAADTVPVLISYMARILLKSHLTSREVSLEEFFVGPGKTIINPSEILTTIFIPKSDRKCGFVKLGKRSAVTCSIVNHALSARLVDNRLSEVVAVFGSVAPKAIRIHELEKFLNGKEPSEELAVQGVELVEKNVSPIDDVRGSAAYRRKMSGILFLRLFRHLFLNKPLGGSIQ